MANNDKTAQAFDMIEQGVKDVYSSDKFKNYLSCLSKFHNYSLNNTLLILYQNPNATHVAGYSAWKYNFNWQVNKGEKGLVILAPFPTKETRYGWHTKKSKDKGKQKWLKIWYPKFLNAF